MKLTMRTHQNDEDYWSIREFLRRVMILNDCHELSWYVARWVFGKGQRLVFRRDGSGA